MTTFPQKVELPRGQHALLRDPEEVTERARRAYVVASEAVYAGLADAGVDPEQFEAAQDLVSSGAVSEDGIVQDEAAVAKQALVIKLGLAGLRTGMSQLQRVADDHLAACFVQEWSYGVPVSADAMLDIPSKARALIVAACKPLADGMTPDFEPNQDEGSPTTPSNA